MSIYSCSNQSDCNAEFEAVILFEDNDNYNIQNYKQIKCNFPD